MRLKTLGAKYFMSFGEWNEIHFQDEQQIVSIVGEWANEPKRSNRSGKSTFVETIIYALYGKSRSKKELDLINKSFPDEDMVVELTFETDDNEEIIIQRGRSSTNQIILELTGFEGADKKVIQEEIDKIIGLNYNDFIMTSFFLQGDIHTFMEAGATGQKQVIAKWLEKDYWKAFEKRAKELQQDIQKSIDKNKLIAEDKPDIDRDNEIKNDIIYGENNRVKLDEVLATLNTQLEEINNQIKKADDIEDSKKEIKRIQSDIEIYEEDIEILNKNIKKYEEEIPEAKERDKQLKLLPKFKETVDKAKQAVKENDEKVYEKVSELADAKAATDALRNMFNEMKDFGNICPVMRKPCAAVESVEDSKKDVKKNGIKAKKVQEEIQGELAFLRQSSKELKVEYEQMNDEYREIKSQQNMHSESDLLKLIEKTDSTVESKTYSLKEQKKKYKLKLKELKELEDIDTTSLKSQKYEIKNEVAVKKRELMDIINHVASLNAELAQIKQKRKNAIAAERENKKLTESLNHHKMVSFMFSKNGIPSNQVEVAFNEIEEEANIILEKVNSDISIEFTPDREMKTWEENCLVCNTPFPKGYRKIECPECDAERQKKRKDELNISIKTQGNEIDFNLESGGGKVLISLAIRLAFVRMLQRRLGVNLKLIVLDEIFGMLDETNRNNVFKMLTSTLIDDFGFSQIFCISHEEEIRDVIPHQIKVIKYDEYSEFGWA
jgi:exonuclease SbcC